jgi:hypothetical protein
MALFEVLGLISDPTMPIDPDGALANALRVALKDARLILPPDVLRMFPEARQFTEKPVEITINVATVMSAIQSVAATANHIADELERGARHLERRLRALQAAPPRVSLGAVLEALPPELRKVRLSGSFAGFEATAVLVLANAGDTAALAAIFERRGQPRPGSETPSLAIGTSVDPDEVARYRPNLPTRRGARDFDPLDPQSNIFLGIEFEGFGDSVTP